MGFKLRPYQKEAVDAGLKFLTGRSKKPGIIVAPCGAGKSLLISKIAHEINRPTLVLQPSKEILGSIGSGGPFGSKLCRMRKQCISKCRKQQRFRSIIFRRRQLRIGFR